MSSDLLKEFGSQEANAWNAAATQTAASKTSTDEDEFGDFEAPETEGDVLHTQSWTQPPNTFGRSTTAEWSGLTPSPAEREYFQSHNRSSTTYVQDATSNEANYADSKEFVIFDADEEAARHKVEAERTSKNQLRPEGPIKDPTTSKKAYTPASRIATTNPVKIRQRSQEVTEDIPRSSNDASKRLVETTKAAIIEAPVTDDEPWDDFEAVEEAKFRSVSSSAPPSHTFKATEVSRLGPPPSNIPPPSILLPVIASVFRSLTTDLKAITSHQPLDQPNTLSQLRTLLSTLRAAARIIAGRKLRWKRDTLLSQSMKIGPAHSGKAGGMKLAGVDKAESRREDQEAAEALQMWKQQAGPLRSTFAALFINNGHSPEQQQQQHERFKIPEMADNMPIRQGKVGEGVLTAPKCCFLCGIKRDERVAKVDVDVEDSFGEWWVEHWGHVDCFVFWENHKHSLRQR